MINVLQFFWLKFVLPWQQKILNKTKTPKIFDEKISVIVENFFSSETSSSDEISVSNEPFFLGDEKKKIPGVGVGQKIRSGVAARYWRCTFWTRYGKWVTALKLLK